MLMLSVVFHSACSFCTLLGFTLLMLVLFLKITEGEGRGDESVDSGLPGGVAGLVLVQIPETGTLSQILYKGIRKWCDKFPESRLPFHCSNHHHIIQ